MDSRRSFLRAVGAVGIAGATAGCVGVITGAEPAEFSAGVATVPAGTLEETGYESIGVEDLEVDETVSVAGQERRVVVTNRLAQYDKAVELPTGDRYQGALFAVLTTPAIEVLGRTMNPVAELGTGELARRALTEFEGFGDLREEGTGTATVLGSETEVGLFLTDAEVAAGVTTEVRIHVAEAVRAGEDFVVPIGAYPTMLSGEDEHVRTMMAGIEHADD